MKKLIYLIFIPLLMVGMGCSDDEEHDTIIPTTDYVLGENCSWAFETSELGEDNLYQINSQDELALFITCATGSFSAINFDKYTLLLVQGVLPSIGYDRQSVLKKDDETDSYLLCVDMYANNIQLPAPTKYVVALLTPKLTGNTLVQLAVNIHPYK